MVDLVLGSCVLLYSRLNLRFSLMRSKMARLIGGLGSLQLYVLGVDVSTAFMSLSHNQVGKTEFEKTTETMVEKQFKALSMTETESHRKEITKGIVKKAVK